MENTTKYFLGLIGGVLLVGLAVMATLFLSPSFCKKHVEMRIPPNRMEYLDRFHDPETKVTAIRAFAAEKCYILINDKNPGEIKTLRIVPEALSTETLKALAGEAAVEFCDGWEALPVRIINEREKRQAGTGGDAAALRRTEFRLRQNQCQNNVIVDCGSSGGNYECTTGPGQVYRAKTTCLEANRFSFNVEPRCKEFPKTEKFRLLKCIQAFIYGTHTQQ